MENFVLLNEFMIVSAELIAKLIGCVGIIVIVIGCARGVWSFALSFRQPDIILADIRLQLGHYFALGLEFLIGKDIIETLLHPQWEDLGKLAAIIALRTILTFFLGLEFKEVQEEIKAESTIQQLKSSLARKK